MSEAGGLPLRITAGALTVALLAVVLTIAEPATPPAPQRHEVRIEQFEFRPQVLRVAVGDTVVWTNRDIVPHTATDRAGRWDSGSMKASGTWKMTVRERGEQKYECALHPTMTATIIAQ